MIERIFDAAKEIITQEVKDSVNQGKKYFGQASTAPGVLAQQIGSVIDQLGYAWVDEKEIDGKTVSAHWVTSRVSLTGARPGLISKTRCAFRARTLRSLIR